MDAATYMPEALKQHTTVTSCCGLRTQSCPRVLFLHLLQFG